MKTKRQEELINSFLSEIADETKPLYQDIAMYLSELGYNPQKQRAYIVFKHDHLHNKQIAKMGINKKELTPYFSLRFSACKEYSEKFADLVKTAVSKENFQKANCLNNECVFCAGEAITHVYSYTFPDGETKFHCGAYTIEIPDITPNDIAEIKKLIYEEHKYLLKHQAGVSIS